MAEFLIYNKNHWMDLLSQAQYDEQMKNPNFAQKFLARYRPGDIVEVRPDGFWTGAKARGFDKAAFRVVAVTGLKDDKMYMDSTPTKRRRYSIDTGAKDEIKVVASINLITITDKGV